MSCIIINYFFAHCIVPRKENGERKVLFFFQDHLYYKRFDAIACAYFDLNYLCEKQYVMVIYKLFYFLAKIRELVYILLYVMCMPFVILSPDIICLTTAHKIRDVLSSFGTRMYEMDLSKFTYPPVPVVSVDICLGPDSMFAAAAACFEISVREIQQIIELCYFFNFAKNNYFPNRFCLMRFVFSLFFFVQCHETF